MSFYLPTCHPAWTISTAGQWPVNKTQLWRKKNPSEEWVRIGPLSDFPEETRSQRGLENLKGLEDRRRNSWIEIVLGETAVCISHTIMCQILCLVFTRITPIYLSHRSDEKSKNSILPWRRGNEIWDRILTHVSLTMMIMTITTTMAANIYMTMIMCQSLSCYLSSPHKSPVRKEPFLFQVLQIRKLEHEG